MASHCRAYADRWRRRRRLRQTAGSGLLRAPSGLEIPLQPDQIGKMERLKVSLMPEGLEQGMTVQDVADLIAFVQKPPG